MSSWIPEFEKKKPIRSHRTEEGKFVFWGLEWKTITFPWGNMFCLISSKTRVSFPGYRILAGSEKGCLEKDGRKHETLSSRELFQFSAHVHHFGVCYPNTALGPHRVISKRWVRACSDLNGTRISENVLKLHYSWLKGLNVWGRNLPGFIILVWTPNWVLTFPFS